MKTYHLFTNAEWVDAISGETFDDYDPYTGEIYARIQKGDARDADRAIAAIAARIHGLRFLHQNIR